MNWGSAPAYRRSSPVTQVSGEKCGLPGNYREFRYCQRQDMMTALLHDDRPYGDKVALRLPARSDRQALTVCAIKAGAQRICPG